MRIGMAAIAVLALGAGAAQAQTEAQTKDCGLKQYDSIAMEVSPNQLLLPVTFGTTPRQMVFHLEDSANGMAANSVTAMDLYVTSISPNIRFHRDGQDITQVAHVPEVHLGKQTIKGMEFLVIPQGRYNDRVIGDIGTRMFEKVDFELDMAGGKLNLFSPDHCPGNTVYWTKSGFAQVPLQSADEMGYIRTEMMLDGQPIKVGLSTVGRSRIGMNAMRRLFHVDETSPDLTVVDQDLLGRKVYRYPFKALIADGLTVTNPAILVYDEAPRPECNGKLHFDFPEHESLHSTDKAQLMRCLGGDDVVLGLSVLSKLHLYVSGQEKMLYLTSAQAK